MTYSFHPEARIEYREAILYYEASGRDLSDAFTHAIESAIEMICRDPKRWRRFEQDVRRCLAHRFPYAVLYTIEDDGILIIAVMHGSREPGYWRYRIERR